MKVSSCLIVAALTLSFYAAGSCVAQTLYPPTGAKAICPDTPLRITFSSEPKLGAAGKIIIHDTADGATVESIDISSPTAVQSIGGVPHFKYYPVIITGNTAALYPHNHSLNWNKSYYVTVDPGVFTTDGKDFPGFPDRQWQFSTKAFGPPAGTAKVTIAADGTGDFCTVQGALDWVPDGNITPTTLFIRSGTYTELILFINKHNLTLQGEDRKQTIIQYANNNRFNSANDQRVYHRGVFLAKGCNGLTITNLTITDTTPRGGSQAEAIILNGTTDAHAVLRDVDLYSYQDTLQINGQAYLQNCHIEGDVDFMWGTGPSFFEDCQCVITRSKGYFTQIRNPGTNHGYVYYHCTLTGTPGVTGAFLSRIDPSVFPYSEVALIDCTLDASVGDVGWLLNRPRNAPKDAPVNAPNVHFWEFNSHDAQGKPIDTSKRLDISRQLKQPDDAETIAHYSDAVWVLGESQKPQKGSDPATSPAESQSH